MIRPEGCVCGGLCSDTQQPFIIGSRAPRRKCVPGPPWGHLGEEAVFLPQRILCVRG